MDMMTVGAFNRAALEQLERVGGVALMAKVIDQFLEKVPQRMDDACDRGRAGDLTAMENALESIKDAAGNVGATEVSEMAGRIGRLAEAGAKDVVLPLLCQLDDMLGSARTWLQREKSTLRGARGSAWH
jgi:HPt (histidine-containing phosphotransfer) domain-containing protein